MRQLVIKVMNSIKLVAADSSCRGIRRGFTAVRLQGLQIRTPPRTWISAFCDCSVLSARGLCDGLNTHPEESYRVWCV